MSPTFRTSISRPVLRRTVSTKIVRFAASRTAVVAITNICVMLYSLRTVLYFSRILIVKLIGSCEIYPFRNVDFPIGTMFFSDSRIITSLPAGSPIRSLIEFEPISITPAAILHLYFQIPAQCIERPDPFSGIFIRLGKKTLLTIVFLTKREINVLRFPKVHLKMQCL